MIRSNNKNQRGFTLVEVIVVAVIVAAMAAVAVPVYLNYVNNSRLNAATNAAGATASFLASCRNGGGTVAALDAAAETAAPGAVLTCLAGVGGGTTLTIPNNITITHVAGNAVTGTWDHGLPSATAASTPYSY